MTDFEQFKAFFDGMGIVYTTWENTENGCDRHGNEPKESIFLLLVSQAQFCFDKDKMYIGVVSDELGEFEPRRV